MAYIAVSWSVLRPVQAQTPLEQARRSRADALANYLRTLSKKQDLSEGQKAELQKQLIGGPYRAYTQQHEQAMKELLREYQIKLLPTKELTPELERALQQEAQDALKEANESPEADIKKTMSAAETQNPQTAREPSTMGEGQTVMKSSPKKSSKSTGDSPPAQSLDGSGIPAVLEFGSTPAATDPKLKNSH